MQYSQPLFRPPSEAYSLILQVTLGCSWNKCAFCEMYTSKNFTVRKEQDVLDEIKEIRDSGYEVRKIFLADGNPLVLSTRRLMNVLKALNGAFPKLRRISTYALPGDIMKKSATELKEISDAGLKLLYVGIESGDDELLSVINKDETYNSTVEGLLKSQSAGIDSSVMILLGLGGKKYSKQHALNSARVLNAIQPYFASTLVLSFPFGVEHYIKRFNGKYVPMQIEDILLELKIFLENTELKRTIFRSDHASNYMVLKGTLGKDKERFLSIVNDALENPEDANLRPEWMRGL